MSSNLVISFGITTLKFTFRAQLSNHGTEIIEYSFSQHCDATPKGSAPNLPEVDPKKLVTKDRSIGYERANGFLEMTNFKVEISGYVADGTGVVMGYLAQMELEIMDDDASEESR